MKKTTLLILLIVFSLSLCSCSKEESTENEEIRSEIQSAIWTNEDVVRWTLETKLYYSNVSTILPSLSEVEEATSTNDITKYIVTGNMNVSVENAGIIKVPFSAVALVNSLNEVTFESVDISIDPEDLK